MLHHVKSVVLIPLYSPRKDLEQGFHLPVALRRVNSDTVPIVVVGSASERLML